jgi:uncharacterized UPF0160 family protein
MAEYSSVTAELNRRTEPEAAGRILKVSELIIKSVNLQREKGVDVNYKEVFYAFFVYFEQLKELLHEDFVSKVSSSEVTFPSFNNKKKLITKNTYNAFNLILASPSTNFNDLDLLDNCYVLLTETIWKEISEIVKSFSPAEEVEEVEEERE